MSHDYQPLSLALLGIHKLAKSLRSTVPGSLHSGPIVQPKYRTNQIIRDWSTYRTDWESQRGPTEMNQHACNALYSWDERTWPPGYAGLYTKPVASVILRLADGVRSRQAIRRIGNRVSAPLQPKGLPRLAIGGSFESL